MISQSAPVIAEKKKQNITKFYLVNIGDAYFYTDSPVAISYGGDTYNPHNLRISGFGRSDGSPLDGGQVMLGNVNNEISALILLGLLDDQLLTAYAAHYDANMTLVTAEIFGCGRVDGRPGFNELWAALRVTPVLNTLTQVCPRTRYTRDNYPHLPVKGSICAWGNVTITVG
jgi:hypothetical protein